jgi:hypothetical protein
MAMGQQDFVQPLESQPAAQDLPLGALSAVDQEALVIVHHHRRGESSLDGWCGGGRPEEDELDH